MLRIGLVGCGLVALSVHLKNLPRIPDIQLVAVADTDAKRRARASQLAPHARVLDNYHALLADPTIDAVIISVPYEQHADAAIAALDAGKHIYLEKPFATNLTDAQRILDRYRTSDRVAMMGFNYRFHPLYQSLWRSLQSNQVGTLVSLRSVFCFAPQTGIDWEITRHGSFGAIFDIAPHHIDLARLLLGSEVAEVLAQTRSLHSNNDTVLLQLRMANDVLVQSLFCLHSIEAGQVELYGTAGKLAVDHYRSLAVDFTPTSVGRFDRLSQSVGQLLQPLTQRDYVLEKLRSPWNEPSFPRAIRQFVTAIQQQQPASPNFEDGYRNQQVIDAAQESFRTGAVIRLPG